MMKAYNVRQLKNNPSQALRDARQDPVVVLNRDRPEALIVHLDDESLLQDAGVRRALATALYRDGGLSLGKAARVADVPVAEFMLHVSRLGIPVIRGSATEADADADVIESWLTGSS
jgi:predicted HTH domain antitoxin